LDDSLPKSVLERIGSERASLVKTATHLKGELTTGERTKLKQLSTKVIEQYLDNGAGACHVKHAAIASVVAEALRHFDNRRYLLFAWCVIPNHVHMVLRILPAHALAEVVHSWKSFLRRRMSSLNLSGGFW
jgi:REP element-mobilizing transposase RayT